MYTIFVHKRTACEYLMKKEFSPFSSNNEFHGHKSHTRYFVIHVVVWILNTKPQITLATQQFKSKYKLSKYITFYTNNSLQLVAQIL